MAKRVSLKDIAELAGVSHSTVSRALHGRGRMSEATRNRILALAEDVSNITMVCKLVERESVVNYFEGDGC